MGLSKKLGQSSSPQTSATGSQIVAYQWSHQSYTIQDILKKFKLPCVVQCATESCTVVWSDFQFDLRQPLLLYSLRTVRKIHARSLEKDTLEEFGPPVAIPEDYEGWFASTPKGVNKLKRHTRVKGIADANATSFLVCTKCPAFTSSKSTGSNLDFIPHDVAEGEVLKRVCIMEEDGNDSNTPRFVQTNGPCLECLDERGEDVLLPLNHRVMTYEIADSFPDEEHKVFSTKSVIAAGNKHLPRVFTVVQGDPPALTYSFTGLYRAYTVFTEETLLAATLDDPKSTCLELVTDSCAKFKIGLNDALIKKTCEYANAYQVCHCGGDKFSTGIKVSFSLTPQTSGLDDIDLTVYETMSSDGVQEVDANSEFEIAWGSGGKANLSPGNFAHTNVQKEKLSEGESSDKIDQGKLESVNEISGSCSIEKSEEDDKFYSEIIPHSETCDQSKLTEPLSTSVGEDIVKENPLFMSAIPDSENELDLSIISEDIVEISIEETDYNTMIIKKASEYDDDLVKSDNSDSEVEEAIMSDDEVKDETNFVGETMENNLPHDGIGITSDPISLDEGGNNDHSEISESGNKADSVTVSTQPIKGFNSNQPDITNGNETGAISNSCTQPENVSSDADITQDLAMETTVSNQDLPMNGAIHQDTLLSLPFKPSHDLDNASSIIHRTEPVHDTSFGVAVQCDKIITETTRNDIESSPAFKHDKTSTGYSNSLPHKPKSNKKQKAHESRIKSHFSSPLLGRLRKFKSGSNVNVCSDTESVPDNKFQSSKVKHLPHSHPHKEREASQEKTETHKRPKSGLLRLDENDTSPSPLKSAEGGSIDKQMTVLDTRLSENNSEMSGPNITISDNEDKLNPKENVHEELPITHEKFQSEKEQQKIVIPVHDDDLDGDC